ncbi:MAG: hypothetical protein MUE40_07535 [Anaerolineae bacterium]|jgi:hypothetical protein|nr:hypothetical protein [Anaerolineae bacterium]
MTMTPPLITWRLWRVLLAAPPRHPVFWRTVNQPGLDVPPAVWRSLAALALLGLLVALAASPLLLVLVLYWVILLPVALLLFSGTWYGLYRALDISVTLGQERRQGTYDLLRLTPPGAAGIDWLIGAGCMHRGNGLWQLHRIIRAIVISALLAFGVVALFILLSLTATRDVERLALSQQALSIVATLIALCCLCYCDHVQSLVTGCLVGLLVGHAAAPLAARLWSALLFLLCQGSAYAGVVAGALLLRPLLQVLTAATLPGSLFSAAAIIALYVLLREAQIRLLWRISLRRAHLTPAEWQRVWHG